MSDEMMVDILQIGCGSFPEQRSRRPRGPEGTEWSPCGR